MDRLERSLALHGLGVDQMCDENTNCARTIRAHPTTENNIQSPDGHPSSLRSLHTCKRKVIHQTKVFIYIVVLSIININIGLSKSLSLNLT